MSKSGVKGPRVELGFTNKQVDESHAWGYQTGFLGYDIPNTINVSTYAEYSAYVKGYNEGYRDYIKSIEEEYNSL